MKRETKIGVFAVAVLTSSFFVINYLRSSDIFVKEIRLNSHYENVEGLIVSDPVYYKGFKVGTVTGLNYNSQTGVFDVTCTVMKKYPVPSDSKMTIYSVDLMGGKGIRLDLGNSSEMAVDGSELIPSYAPDMMSSLTDKLGPLVVKVSDMLDSLTITSGSVNRILDAVDEGSIKKVLAHTENTLANLESVSGKLADRYPDIDTLVLNLRNVSAKLDKISNGASDVVDSLAVVSGQLSGADIAGLIGSVRSIADKINNPDGTIGKMLTDDSAYNTLEELLSDIDSLVRKIEENPKKYVRIRLL